jgi:hypothetical protein
MPCCRSEVLGLELDVPLGERDDVGVDAERDDGCGGAVRELTGRGREREAEYSKKKSMSMYQMMQCSLQDDNPDHQRAGRGGVVHAAKPRAPLCLLCSSPLISSSLTFFCFPPPSQTHFRRVPWHNRCRPVPCTGSC